MPSSDWREQLLRKVRVLQILVGGMIMGSFLFLIMALLLTMVRRSEANQSILTYMGLAMAGIDFCVWMILPGLVISQGRKKICQTLLDIDKQVNGKSTSNNIEAENKLAMSVLELFQTKTLAACAMLEGAVFLLLIIYIAEAHIFSILAAVAMLILLVMQVPTIGRMTYWVEDQMRLVKEQRAFN